MERIYEKLTFSVYEVWHWVRRMERKEIDKMGLKHGLAHVLLTIQRSEDGMTATQLCAACDKDKAAISRILAELDKEGLAQRDTDRGNHYRAKVRLTPKGECVAKTVEITAQEAVTSAMQGLSEEQLSILMSSLDAIGENLKKAFEI